MRQAQNCKLARPFLLPPSLAFRRQWDIHVQMPRRGRTYLSFCVLSTCYSKLKACSEYLRGRARLPGLGVPVLRGFPSHLPS